MAIERIVDTSSHDDDAEERRIEVSLRPQSFNEYVGQERLKRNLRLAIEAAKKRGEPLDHVLLYGPPGLGKTTMATVIANEMGTNLRVTSGPAIEKAGDLASILTNLADGDILFIDEIHRLGRAVEEILYSAMEDFKLDIVIGKGPAARSIRLDLPQFTVIGATTRTGSLAAPLRDRFANRLLKRVRDYADVNGDGIIDVKTTTSALEMLEVDELGLDPADRNLLQSILENYGDNPVGLTTIAALTGDEATTIEDFYEPYLLQIGFIERTPRGRRVTPRAKKHINML